jgi:hypothetical protein
MDAGGTPKPDQLDMFIRLTALWMTSNFGNPEVIERVLQAMSFFGWTWESMACDQCEGLEPGLIQFACESFSNKIFGNFSILLLQSSSDFSASSPFP